MLHESFRRLDRLTGSTSIMSVLVTIIGKPIKAGIRLYVLFVTGAPTAP